MKNLLILFTIGIITFSCSSDEEVTEDILNTENSILITGINESISYTFSNANGRTESSVPEDINMLQILILNELNEIVYEQYHYNNNAYNEHYYDSAEHEGDDYLFENTLPDTLFIPPLADGSYTVLASTAYASFYGYNYEDSLENSYPIIESYQVSDNPIFVGKATADVTEDTDAMVVLDMQNISARMDLNITTSSEDWSIELQFGSANSTFYSFELESLELPEYDYSSFYLWRDHSWAQESYYFLPRSIEGIDLWFYENEDDFDLNYQFDIDPDLEMEIGDVFTLNINIDDLKEAGGSAGFTWEEVDWNDLGDITIP